MAAPVEQILATWNSLKPENLANQLDVLDQLIQERRVLSTKDGQASIVAQINQALSSSQTRLNGLLLIVYHAGQIPPNVFRGQILSWIDQMITFLKQYQQDYVYKLTCRVLATLIRCLSKFPEQSYQATIRVIPELYHVLILATPAWRDDAVLCLLSCLQYFRGPAGPVKEKLTKFLVPVLTSSHEEKLQTAVDCYCYLASAGGGGHQGSRHTEAWTTQFSELLHSINTLLSTAYSQIDNGDEDDETNSAGHDLPWLCDVTEEDFTLIAQRFSLSCQMAARMLTLSAPCRIQVPVSAIIRVVVRCLSVNARMLEVRPTSSRLELAGVVSILHQAAFSLLNDLILCCGSNLLPHSSTISKICVQTLAWTKPEDDQPRKYCRLRMRVYQLLVTWFSHVIHGLEVDDLLTEMLDDIRPEKSSIKLQSKLNSVSGIMEGKKGKRKKKVTGGNVETGQGDREREPDYQLVTQCLHALDLMIRTSCHRLTVSTLHTIQDLVISTLLKVQLPQQGGSRCVPYNNHLCRHRMYGVATALVLVRHAKWMPAQHVYMAIFSKGKREKNQEIAELCGQSLSLCTTMIHPRVPAMYGVHTPPTKSQTTPTTRSYQSQHAAAVLSGQSQLATSITMTSSPSVTMADTIIHSDDHADVVMKSAITTTKSEHAKEFISVTTVPISKDSNFDSVTKATLDDTSSDDDSSGDEQEASTEDLPKESQMADEKALSSSRGMKRSADSESRDLELDPKVRITEGDSENDNEDSAEVDAMLMTFKDVGPDSD